MSAPSAALSAGTLAAVVAALPAVARVSQSGVNPVVAALALAGGTALVLGPALVCAARVPRGSSGFRAWLLGLAFAATPLALLGERLKLHTHHRPLGAATFAVLALGIVLAAGVVAARLLHFAASGSSLPRRLALGLGVAAALASVGVVLFRALGPGPLGVHALDGLRAVAAAALCHLGVASPRVSALARRAGVPLWTAAVVAGLAATAGGVGAAVRAGSPVLGGPLAWF